MTRLTQLTAMLGITLAAGGCTTADGLHALSFGSTSPALSTIILQKPLEVREDTARALIGSGTGSSICEVEVNTVRAIGDPATVVQPGRFEVLWSRETSDPFGSAIQFRLMANSANAPAFVDTRFTIRVASNEQPDVRAFHCSETFYFLERARFPGVEDLIAAGDGAVAIES